MFQCANEPYRRHTKKTSHWRRLRERQIAGVRSSGVAQMGMIVADMAAAIYPHGCLRNVCHQSPLESLLGTFPSASNNLLVEALLAAHLLLLNLVELALKLASVLSRQDLLNDGTLLLLAGEALARSICGTGDDSPNLAILGNEILSVIFFEVLLSHSDDIPHPKDL